MRHILYECTTCRQSTRHLTAGLSKGLEGQVLHSITCTRCGTATRVRCQSLASDAELHGEPDLATADPGGVGSDEADPGAQDH